MLLLSRPLILRLTAPLLNQQKNPSRATGVLTVRAVVAGVTFGQALCRPLRFLFVPQIR